jgi:hypothetical protein
MSGKPETGDVRLKRDTRERLGEKIGGVYNSRSVVDNKQFGFDVRVNEMITDVDVFSLAVIGIID